MKAFGMPTEVGIPNGIDVCADIPFHPHPLDEFGMTHCVGFTRVHKSLKTMLSKKAEALVIRPSCIWRNQA
jgi:hypothetical protein